jgi:hypothetical protein
MTARTEPWRDHTATARREHIFGRIVPMERPEGEPSLLAGLSLLLLIVAAVWLAIIAFPPASDAPPASSHSATGAVESGASGNRGGAN